MAHQNDNDLRIKSTPGNVLTEERKEGWGGWGWCWGVWIWTAIPKQPLLRMKKMYIPLATGLQRMTETLTIFSSVELYSDGGFNHNFGQG